VKLIWLPGSGLCLFAKRPEQGGLPWPRIENGSIRLSAAQLAGLIEGMEWTRVQSVEPRPPMATQQAAT
jgi:transposase